MTSFTSVNNTSFPQFDGFSLCQVDPNAETLPIFSSLRSCSACFNRQLYSDFYTVYRNALDRSFKGPDNTFHSPSDKEWYEQLQNLQRGYVFRGDTRDPQEIKETGGLWPRITLQTNPEITPNFDPLNHHGGDLSRSPFVSGTTSSKIAKLFAGSGGWVYSLYANGCIVYGKSTECEVLMPGGCTWNDVIGFSQVQPSGPIYIRNDLAQSDPAACRQIYKALNQATFYTNLSST